MADVHGAPGAGYAGRKTRVTHEEDGEQMTLMEWAGLREGMLPELKWLFHIPNGGKRNPREAGRLKAMGVKSGVSDLFLPVPMGKYHGLWIEMKRQDGGHTSADQKKWIEDMRKNGYKAEVCRGWQEAARVIEQYLTRRGDNE